MASPPRRLRRGTPRRFGALASPLLSRVPVLVTGGNEIGSSEAWLHYMHRWPTPYREARSTSPLYWSVDVGPAHVVALNSYDNFVHHGDRLQRKWLEDDLSQRNLITTVLNSTHSQSPAQATNVLGKEKNVTFSTQKQCSKELNLDHV